MQFAPKEPAEPDRVPSAAHVTSAARGSTEVGDTSQDESQIKKLYLYQTERFVSSWMIKYVFTTMSLMITNNN